MLKKNRSLTAVHLVLLALAKDVAVLLERRPCESSLAPQVGGKESVCVGDGDEGSLQCVLKGLGGTSGCGVGILDTSQLQETLDSGRGNETGTAGGGDETDGDGTALAGLLGGERVRLTEVGTPVTTTDGDNGELGDDDGSADGGRDFLGGLDTETNVALGVTDDNDSLEAGTLTGTGLLLDGLDLHNLVLELGEEEVDDLVLLDGERVEVAVRCQYEFLAQSRLRTYISSMLLILPAFTRRPSLVTGCHSFSCANCQFPAICPSTAFICAPQSFRHGGHGHVRDHVHGHHRGLHENRIRRERGQERQP